MKYKNILIFVCLFICLFSIAGISASEITNETSDIVKMENDDSSFDFEINEFDNNKSDDSVRESEIFANDFEGTVDLTEEKNELLTSGYVVNWEDMESHVSRMSLSYLDSNGNTVSSSNYVTISQYGKYNQFIDVKMKTAFTGSIEIKYDTYNYLTNKALDYTDSFMPTDFEEYFYSDEGIQTFSYDL